MGQKRILCLDLCLVSLGPQERHLPKRRQDSRANLILRLDNLLRFRRARIGMPCKLGRILELMLFPG